MKITFDAYMGLTAFATLLATVLGFVISLAVLAARGPIVPALIFSIIAAMMAALISFGACYAYPILQISSKVRKIEANLPMTANFMSVLASSGMPPERIFRSLANVGDEFGVGDEVRRAVADTEIMGLDLNDALRRASVRSASRKFGAMLDGIVATSHMGGDLASYLRDEADKFKKARTTAMKSFLDSLAGMAEMYVSFMIALPLVLVVMLSVMSFLGGSISLFGGLDPSAVMILMTFVVTPAGVMIMLLLVDSLTPPR
ncbi:MAG: type II secretion system F family protein [Candidatus Bathyarchaeota archaeon]|nr:type II secretion system F family protein [Candidatus Bathyarchaeota archaeon]